MKTIKTTILTALLLFTGSALFAQSGDINASATVLDAITVQGAAPLIFGDVERNTSSSVLVTNADNRGAFSILGSNRDVFLNFTLPSALTFDGNNLPISFSSTDAVWNNGNGDNTFDPNADDVEASINGGDLDVYIGGTVTAAEDQEPGEYTGTITLQVDYDI